MKKQIEIKCKTCGKVHIRATLMDGEINLEWKCKRCKNKNIVTLKEMNKKLSEN